MLAVLTVKEVAKHLRCETRTVYRLMETGELQSITIGDLRRVLDSQVEDFLRRCMTGEASARTRVEPGATVARPAPTSPSLPAQRVKFETYAKDKLKARRIGTSGGASSSTGVSAATPPSTSSSRDARSTDGADSSRGAES